MPVRSTSIGVVFLGKSFSIAMSLGGSFRLAVEESALTCVSSSLRVGSFPYQRRYVTSSKFDWATSSSTSKPR